MKDSLYLLRQAFIIPILGIINIILGFFVPGYDIVSQRISELALESHFVAYTHRSLDILIGISMSLFSVQILRIRKAYFSFFLIFAFGMTWIFAGIFILTNPLHDIYGLTTVLIIIPSIFTLEFKDLLKFETFTTYSILTSVIHIIFFWFFNYGFISQEYAGISQRIWVFITLLWYGIAANQLFQASKMKMIIRNNT